MNDVAEPDHVAAAATIRRLLAVYDQHEDLLSLGAYRRGGNPELDVAIDMREAIAAIFRQPVDRALPLESIVEELIELAGNCQNQLSAPATAA
jgi:flagellum-specific ATP synthase